MSPDSECIATTGQAGRRAGRRARRVCLALAVGVALVGAAGCGSSSKPAYCKDRSTLESSIKALPGLVKSADLSGLQTQLTTIQADATTLASSAKSDFPSQSSAVKSSVDTLKTAVDGLPSSPSASQIAPVALDAATVVSSISDFTKATDSKCS